MLPGIRWQSRPAASALPTMLTSENSHTPETVDTQTSADAAAEMPEVGRNLILTMVGLHCNLLDIEYTGSLLKCRSTTRRSCATLKPSPTRMQTYNGYSNF